MKERRMRWDIYILRMELMRNDTKFCSEKPYGKGRLERPRHRWEGNIRMDLRELRCEDVDSVHLAQDRDQWHALVMSAINFWVQ
jgi:hypothetical protein